MLAGSICGFLATIPLIYLAALACACTFCCMSLNVVFSRSINPIAPTLLRPSCSRACLFAGLSSAGARRHHSLARVPWPPTYTRLQISTRSTTAPGSAVAERPFSSMSAEVPPATLPGTPKNFPIGEEKLISMAQEVFETDSGQKDSSVLSDDFRFEFPIVSLSKQVPDCDVLTSPDYLNATGTFNLNEAFPNMDAHPYHWRVDPYEPNRVWFTTRVTATHVGPLKFFKKSFKPTNKKVLGAPECLSYTFNEQGKVTSFTGGYIMDRRVGNTKKMGALFGILAAIGGPIPEPETIPYAFFILSNRLSDIFSTILGKLTFGMIGKKQKQS